MDVSAPAEQSLHSAKALADSHCAPCEHTGENPRGWEKTQQSILPALTKELFHVIEPRGQQ